MRSGHIDGYPFREGEEHLARAALERTPAVPSLEFGATDFRFSERAGVTLLRTTIWVGPLVGAGLLALGILDWAWWSLGALVFAILFPPVVLEFVHHVTRSRPSSIEISAKRQLILVDHEPLARFDDLGVPRLVLHRRKLGEEMWETPAIAMEHRVGPDVILFDFPFPRELLARLPQIADHINAIFVEHEQRKAIREWLERREAEIADSRFYR